MEVCRRSAHATGIELEKPGGRFGRSALDLDAGRNAGSTEQAANQKIAPQQRKEIEFNATAGEGAAQQMRKTL